MLNWTFQLGYLRPALCREYIAWSLASAGQPRGLGRGDLDRFVIRVREVIWALDEDSRISAKPIWNSRRLALFFFLVIRNFVQDCAVGTGRSTPRW